MEKISVRNSGKLTQKGNILLVLILNQILGFAEKLMPVLLPEIHGTASIFDAILKLYKLLVRMARNDFYWNTGPQNIYRL